MPWAPRIYKEQAPSGNPLRELGDAEGTAGEDKHQSAGKQGARNRHLLPVVQMDVDELWNILYGGCSLMGNTRLEASGALGAWAILLTGLGRVFILRTGTFFFFNPKAMKLWEPGRRRIEVSNL